MTPPTPHRTTGSLGRDVADGLDGPSLWRRLAAPLRSDAIRWQHGGLRVTRGGARYARLVPTVDAETIRERLDAVVPGEWDVTLEALPASPGDDDRPACVFKARLQILGVIREDIGVGCAPEAAAARAFARAAARYGIGHEAAALRARCVRVGAQTLGVPTAASSASMRRTLTGERVARASAGSRQAPSDGVGAEGPGCFSTEPAHVAGATRDVSR